MRMLLFMCTLALTTSAIADCQSASGPYRECYDNRNAPPAMVFKFFVNRLFTECLDYFEDLSVLDRHEYHAGRHVVEAGLTPNMSSADVVRYFVPKFLMIEKEAEELQKKSLCLGDKPRYKGAENFVVFNQLEEISLNVYQKHLYIARADLQASGLFDLDEALKEYPGSFTNMFMDYQQAESGSIKRIYEAAVGLCAQPWGHQFSVSESTADTEGIQN